MWVMISCEATNVYAIPKVFEAILKVTWLAAILVCASKKRIVQLEYTRRLKSTLVRPL
jgi:hypothetical protein